MSMCGARREHALLQLNRASADYLTGLVVDRTEEEARRYSFVRNVEWDYQSRLGGATMADGG